MSSGTTPQFTPRHLVLGRAAAAAIAALMITFSSDHSAALGLSVFSGFAIMTGLVWVLGAWLVVPAGQRTTPIALALISGAAGIVAGITVARTPLVFVITVTAWALLTGALELIQGLRARRAELAEARDQIFVGGLTLLLAVVTLAASFLPTWDYLAPEVGQTFTYSSSILMVGIFGGYAAILAVYLGIAGLSPAKTEPALTQDDAAASGKGLS